MSEGDNVHEIWKDVSEHSGYRISNLGRVVNKKSGLILKPRPDRRGYLRVSLYDKNVRKQKDLLIHRLVANAFHDCEHVGLDVNHIDGRKDNNAIDNLEWCTRSDNLKHCYRTGLRDSPHNRCKSVLIVETGQTFDSVRECARYLGCSHSNISFCLNGHKSTYKGYHFEWFATDDSV